APPHFRQRRVGGQVPAHLPRAGFDCRIQLLLSARLGELRSRSQDLFAFANLLGAVSLLHIDMPPAPPHFTGLADFLDGAALVPLSGHMAAERPEINRGRVLRVYHGRPHKRHATLRVISSMKACTSSGRKRTAFPSRTDG